VRICAAIFVADEPHDAGGGQRPQVVELLRVDQTLDRLPQRDAGADEDRCHHEVACAFLGLEGAQQERDPQRNGGQRVPEVVDQVGQQRDAAGEHEHHELQDEGDQQDEQAPGHRAQPIARGDDRPGDEPVAVAMPVAVSVICHRVAHEASPSVATGWRAPRRRCWT
jgi:hypothetical protein